MSGRFMVPELERVTAFLGARLVAAEVEDSLGEVLPEPPSRTAIQHVLTAVGQCAEDGAEQFELSLETAAPLNAEGDTFVVSGTASRSPCASPRPSVDVRPSDPWPRTLLRRPRLGRKRVWAWSPPT